MNAATKRDDPGSPPSLTASFAARSTSSLSRDASSTLGTGTRHRTLRRADGSGSSRCLGAIGARRWQPDHNRPVRDSVELLVGLCLLGLAGYGVAYPFSASVRDDLSEIVGSQPWPLIVCLLSYAVLVVVLCQGLPRVWRWIEDTAEYEERRKLREGQAKLTEQQRRLDEKQRKLDEKP